MHTASLRVTILALFAVTATTLVLLAPASAAPNKPYSIVICGDGQTGCSFTNPAVIAPGGGTPNPPSILSVTFTNDNKPGSGIQLGSDNLNVPSTPGFAVISASTIVTPTSSQALNQCPASFNNSAPPCFVLLNSGATIGFRNLNLAPGQSAMITLSAATPALSASTCTTSSSPCSWTDEAKQSNDFSGTGNDLNSDTNSAYRTVTGAASSCTKNQTCKTTLADGGTPTGGPGSVSVTINTSSGKSAGTQLLALDFGTPLASSGCSGLTAARHGEYWSLSDDSDRSQKVSITTTPDPGVYQPQVCFFNTDQTFTALVLSNGTSSLAPAMQTTVDGAQGWQGLLANCNGSQLPPPTVNCNNNPGVLQRGVVNPDGTITTVIMVPPGFDIGKTWQ